MSTENVFVNARNFEGNGLLAAQTPLVSDPKDLVGPAIGFGAGLGTGVAMNLGAELRAHGRAMNGFEQATQLAQRTHDNAVAVAQASLDVSKTTIARATPAIDQIKAALPLAKAEAASVAQPLAPLLSGYPTDGKGLGQVGRTVFVRHWLAANPAQAGESVLLQEARSAFGNEATLLNDGRTLFAARKAANTELVSSAISLVRLKEAGPALPEAPAALNVRGTLGRTLLEGGLVGAATIGADYAGMWGAQALGYDRNSAAYRFLQPKGYDTGLAVGGYLGARALGAGAPLALGVAAGGWVIGHTAGMW